MADSVPNDISDADIALLRKRMAAVLGEEPSEEAFAAASAALRDGAALADACDIGVRTAFATLNRRLADADKMNRDLRASLDDLTLMDDAGGFSEELSFDDVLVRTVDMVGRVLPVVAARIHLIDPETRQFDVAYSRGLAPAQEEEVEARLEEGTFAWAIRQGGPVVLPVSGETSGSLVVVPVVVDRIAVGVLSIFSALGGTDYTPHMFDILRSVARREGVNILHARRHRAIRAASERMEAMRNYLDMIVDSMPQGVVTVDADDRVTIFNRTAEILFGRDAVSVRGKRFAEVLPDALAAALGEVLARTRRDDPVVDYEFNFDRGQGVSFRLGITTTPLRDDRRRLLGVVCIFRDLATARELMRLRKSDRYKAMTITHVRDSLREAQKKIRHNERLASIGRMAAGVAHEINNPLGSIAGFIQIILMDMEDDDENREYLEAMQSEVDRMRNIVDSLLDLARQQPVAVETFMPVDMNLVVSESVRVTEPQAREANVDVRLELEPGECTAIGHPDRLKQVVTNLCLNACNAMRESGGVLRISTRSIRDEDAPSVAVVFADTGHGIRAEDLPRIFDPFFTTDKEGGGTGLGLSTVHTIVTQHGGEIDVRSAWGEGAVFTLRLPRTVRGLPRARDESRPRLPDEDDGGAPE